MYKIASDLNVGSPAKLKSRIQSVINGKTLYNDSIGIIAVMAYSIKKALKEECQVRFSTWWQYRAARFLFMPVLG